MVEPLPCADWLTLMSGLAWPATALVWRPWPGRTGPCAGPCCGKGRPRLVGAAWLP